MKHEYVITDVMEDLVSECDGLNGIKPKLADGSKWKPVLLGLDGTKSSQLDIMYGIARIEI